MVRAAAACFCAIVGLASGYALWGQRAAALALSLDRLSLEYDAVRASGSSDSVMSSLEALSRRVREQGEALAQQTEALSRLMGAQDEQAAASLRECDNMQVKIQEQLESCLFARARLEREVAAAKQAAAPPRPGSQTVTETIEMPKIPGVPIKPRPADHDDSSRYDRDDPPSHGRTAPPILRDDPENDTSAAAP